MVYKPVRNHWPHLVFFSVSKGILLLMVSETEETPAKVGIFSVSPACIASPYISNYYLLRFQSKNIPQIGSLKTTTHQTCLCRLFYTLARIFPKTKHQRHDSCFSQGNSKASGRCRGKGSSFHLVVPRIFRGELGMGTGAWDTYLSTPQQKKKVARTQEGEVVKPIRRRRL